MSDAIVLTQQQPEDGRRGPRSSAPATTSAVDPDEVAGPTLIPSGFRFEGLVVIEDAARIDGTLRGDIQGSGRLEIGPEGNFQGRIEIGELVSAGRIDGVVEAERRVELRGGSLLTGTLSTPSLEMADGAVLDARCRTGGESDDPEL